MGEKSVEEFWSLREQRTDIKKKTVVSFERNLLTESCRKNKVRMLFVGRIFHQTKDI